MFIGTKLGRYEICEKIGSGGMGEVYLARDTQLDRNVAVKILLAEFADDADRVRRFKLEAKAVSALSHPYIVTIFEIVEEDDRLFIVYEYVEGETLREKIERNQLSIADAIRITDHAAAALSAAHKAGIVHRDIKPENLMLRDDGYLKILDFGLAKKRAVESDSEAETNSHFKTQKGTILGSASYMSPEQVRGHETDERTDIWGLGVVFYEMLTGANPFRGDTMSDSIAAILRVRPERLDTFIKELPPEFQAISEKLLEKDRADRYQHLDELRTDLGSLAEAAFPGSSTVGPGRSSANAETVAFRSRTDESPTMIKEDDTQIHRETTPTNEVTGAAKMKKWWRRKWLVAPAAGLVALAVFALYNFFHSNLFPNYYNRFENVKITELTNDGRSHSAAIAPDGKSVVFVRDADGKQSLILKETETGTEKEIVEPANAELFQPTYAPNGKGIYYTAKENDVGSLYEYSNGASRKILVDIDSKVTFLPDGYRLAFVRNNSSSGGGSIMIANTVMNETSLEEKLNTKNTKFKRFTEVAWQPHEEQYTVLGLLNNGSDSVVAETYGKGSMYVHSGQDLGSHSKIASFLWLNDNAHFYLDKPMRFGFQQILFAVPPGYNGSQNISKDHRDYSSISATQDGKTVVATRTVDFSRFWQFNPSTRDLKPLSEELNQIVSDAGVSQAPDGRILFAKRTEELLDISLQYEDGTVSPQWRTAKKVQIFAVDREGMTETQLTNEGKFNFDPVPMPDGKYILYGSMRDTGNGIWRMKLDGSDPTQLTKISNGVDSQIQAMPDSKTLVFARQIDTGERSKVMTVSIDGGEASELIPDSQSSDFNPRISPDGKYIAYISVHYDKATSTYKELVKVVRFNGGDVGDTILEEEFDFAPTMQWSPDSKSLCFIEREGAENIWSYSIADKKEKSVTEFESGQISRFIWSLDGKKLLIVRGKQNSDIVLIRDTDRTS